MIFTDESSLALKALATVFTRIEGESMDRPSEEKLISILHKGIEALVQLEPDRYRPSHSAPLNVERIAAEFRKTAGLSSAIKYFNDPEKLEIAYAFEQLPDEEKATLIDKALRTYG